MLSILLFSCSYTLPGIFLQAEKVNFVKSNETFTSLPELKIPDEIPSNIIFIIADGTGIGQISLSYYANSNFSLHRFDHIGLVTTHPEDGDKKVTDSASSGTALATGQKTYNGAIAVNANEKPIKTVVEWAEEFNIATGLVATSTITHATPASFIAHVPSRRMEPEIAEQMAASTVDILLGGGRKHWEGLIQTENGFSFLPSSKEKTIVISELNDDILNTQRVIGLFNDGAMPMVSEGRSPTTTEMTAFALKKLEQNENGFFLMVEESQVDWGGHSNNGDYIAREMESLNELVDYLLDYQKSHPETLVLLTADHECGGVALHDGEHSLIETKFTSDYHSANLVPVFATGPGAEVFDAFFDNIEIGKLLIEFVKHNGR